ncbi:unnamed protein product [Vicia faba]|uniref:cellulase n=1 Tax=Vicia faba TaxID=3906 RepID=A0AAV1A8L3_VICFA|nr:unnamed protein product [Vicia faba]
MPHQPRSSNSSFNYPFPYAFVPPSNNDNPLTSPLTTTETLSPNPLSFSKAKDQGNFRLTRESLGEETLFGFPMAFTTTMLSWSVIEFGGLMKSELSNAKEVVRWATDYLLKATAHPNTIYVQVGDAKKDHACWERPEDMDTPRSVFKVDANAPGSEVAVETAVALAAASLVFRRSDRTYAKILVRRAIRIGDSAGE